MYTITHKELNGLKFIELNNPNFTSKATICLTQGGRLSALSFNAIEVLANYEPNTYKVNYASSILFPFVNRIRDGKYTYENCDHVLECNEINKNNALHGLVYDKSFECVSQMATPNEASVTLYYNYDGSGKGYPFKFEMHITYTVTNQNLSLSVDIKNSADKSLPFSLGWHPYFVSKNLAESFINFDCATTYQFDEQQIITGEVPLDVKMPYPLDGVKLDDGYKLHNHTIEFNTPEYGLQITSTAADNYLQLYTPETLNVIAIEPMTGAADSFNNGKGLQTLQPYQQHNTTWNVAFSKPINSHEIN